jgi:hypothetical protein
VKLYRVYNVKNIWKALCGKHKSNDVHLAGVECGPQRRLNFRIQMYVSCMKVLESHFINLYKLNSFKKTS